MTLCHIGKHKWIYSKFNTFKTNVTSEGEKQYSIISNTFTIRKCLRCGRVDQVIDWRHNEFNRLKLKWRRVK